MGICGCWAIKTGNVYRTGMMFPIMLLGIISHGNTIAVILVLTLTECSFSK